MAGHQRALPLFPARGKPRAYWEPKEPPPKELALHLDQGWLVANWST